MNSANWIALGASLLAAVVAVTVPLVAFRMTMRVEHAKWVRDQRTQLYVDMLTEAYAEKQWFLEEMSRRQVRFGGSDTEMGQLLAAAAERLPATPDVRMSPADRARFGARGQVFASHAVTVAFNELSNFLLSGTLVWPRDDAGAHQARMESERLFERLQLLIRAELGADRGVMLARGQRDEP